MDLRVLSGLLVFDTSAILVAGTVTISFSPFAISVPSPGATLTSQVEIGPVGPVRPYVSTPCRTVGLRRWQTTPPGPAQLVPSANPGSQITITDTITPTTLTIGWTWAIGNLLPEEIPFMVVGDVGAPPLMVRIFGNLFGRAGP